MNSDFNMSNIDWINGFDISCMLALESHLATFVIINWLTTACTGNHKR